MYTSDQVIDLVEAAYERGFSEGARNAFDTAAFLDSFDGAYDIKSDPENDVEPEDATEYDGFYLEVVGQKVDDLTERVAGLERWSYSTPVEAPSKDDGGGFKCGNINCACMR